MIPKQVKKLPPSNEILAVRTFDGIKRYITDKYVFEQQFNIYGQKVIIRYPREKSINPKKLLAL